MMGQMGFMIMQCGMGFFLVVIVYMIWYGFFKVFLFFSVGLMVKVVCNKSFSLYGFKVLFVFIFGLVMGGLGAFIFWMFIGVIGGLGSIYVFLLLFCGIICVYVVMMIVEFFFIVGCLVLVVVFGFLGLMVYGVFVWAVELQLVYFIVFVFNRLYFGIGFFFVFGWLFMIFWDYFFDLVGDGWIIWIYVWVLCFSQLLCKILNIC